MQSSSYGLVMTQTKQAEILSWVNSQRAQTPVDGEPAPALLDREALLDYVQGLAQASQIKDYYQECQVFIWG